MRIKGILAAAAAAAALTGCDFERSGTVTLHGPDPIRLVDVSGAPFSLGAGSADAVVRSNGRRVEVRISQAGASAVFLVPIHDRERTGDFFLSASESGQPVDLRGRRSSDFVPGEPERSDFRVIDEGRRTCHETVVTRACDDAWTVDFRAPGSAVALATFDSVLRRRCEVDRSRVCFPNPPEPRIPRERLRELERPRFD